MAAEGSAPISFAAATAKKQDNNAPLRVVQMDVQVLMAIEKHCTDASPALVTGQLLGLDVGQTLEVTFSFPFPIRGGEYDDVSDGANYQIEMMKCLREVNVDNNTVGWYQSTVIGSYQTNELIETFVSYHETIRRCVCIVYDTTGTGLSAFKAIRLKENFLKMYKENALSAEKLQKAGISFKDVYDEIPIQLNAPALSQALLAKTEPPTNKTATAKDEDILGLGFTTYLSRNLEFLNDCLDDLVAEQQKLSNHARLTQRQQREYTQALNKRKQENIARRALGEELLPEDVSQFKPQPDPSQLDNYLIANQIQTYCDQVGSFGGLALQKLNIMQALQAQS